MCGRRPAGRDGGGPAAVPAPTSPALQTHALCNPRPLQWFYFDSLESLPDEPLPPEEVAPLVGGLP